MNLNVKNGIIHGVNLTKELQRAIALSEKKIYKNPSQKNETPIVKLVIPSVAKNGILYSNNIVLMTPELKVTGKGQADLKKQSLDYRLNLEVISKASLKDSTVKTMSGIKVPLIITGSFANPSVKIDVAAILKAKLKAKIDKKLAAEKAKLKQRLKQEEEALKARLQEQLQKKLQEKLNNKTQDKVKKLLEDKLRDKLKGIF